MTSAGSLVISLDFELFWGIRDKQALSSCEARLMGARAAIPRILDLFERYGIAATWATVGFLFFDDKEELLASLPEELPQYKRPGLTPYEEIQKIGRKEADDPCRMGLSLVRRIQNTPRQEIGSHTFSHYYCLEEGQQPTQFSADLAAARKAAQRLGIDLKSFVFPSNQFNERYLSVCRDNGFKTVRGNPLSWVYDPVRRDRPNRLRRLGRLADTYLPLAPTAHRRAEAIMADLYDIPADIFLRPVLKSAQALEPMRLHRIKAALTSASKSGTNFHLWWHPHNFGLDTDANLNFLEQVLIHYRKLAETRGMKSVTMAEAAA